MEHVVEDCQCEGKWCPQCHQTRCKGCYTRDKKRGDGLDAWCRYCNNAKRKIYREANKEKSRDAQEQSYQNNLPHYRSYQRAYREANREEINLLRREKKYQSQPLEKERRKLYELENRERFSEVKRAQWVRRRALKRNAEGDYTPLEWEQLCIQHNHTCLCCGRGEPEIKLTVDHVIPLSKGGSNYIGNIQPLCLSCNSSKQSKTIDYRMKKEAE